MTSRRQADLEDLRVDMHHRTESSEPLLYDSPSSPRTPWSPAFSFPKPKPLLANASLRRLLIIVASFSIITILAFASISLLSASSLAIESVTHADPSPSQPEAPQSDAVLYDNDTTPYSPYVLGPPTESFRDNLRDDVQYITSWISAGWTNDVMTYMNLIYLGVITSRVPIVGMFTASHVVGGENVPFGDVFDVPRFINESGIDILEWREVKDPESEVLDDIGCWNVWEVTNPSEPQPRGSWVPFHLRLDISYTRAPEWVKLIPNYVHSRSAAFWQLARLAFREELERPENLVSNLPSPEHQVQLPPDEQVVCYDYLYYVVAQRDDEFEHDFAPAWRFVGAYMHWTPELQELAYAYVRRAFGLEDGAEVPPYIAIHQRHGDFKNWCTDPDNTEDCFAPISVIQRRVREIQDEIRLRKGIDIPDTHVILTSDEKDQAWWDEVTALGWVKIDHDAWETEQNYGKWYPVFLDAAIQSSAMGFVGTDRSTYSTVSRRRVEDWQDGATRTIKWGYKGADDH
ncbi:uncharacterized protein C8Q71DRAFT_578541 [Rhodofomes roseus]|uniref:Uncharacterized protein n=1 Tax=Rhodofomes roseus TaxID=34475 RepID=A0ABQ8KGG4_9APHY|nr:uncharacterized protein C8Q71DRAFT_578541 [Rhodofomes roseus]KAH9836945.1 hypothetical protein C8Q71DRAFT_578541 [Rhodofomes roseus]